ncbi:hypothetical protein [Terrarubrum flagellatum]|uniref:hypothetical protein n=1 Tax=Terrirubrum flagellatum TaxID=2895980 RepID=UPI0031456D31
MNTLPSIGAELARCRKLGALSEIELVDISSLAAAEEIQAEALESFDGKLRGYALNGADMRTRRAIGCDAPVFCPIGGDEIRSSEERYRLPYGVLGAGAGFAFTFGREYPSRSDEMSPTLAGSIVTCQPVIQLVGRRLHGSIPLDQRTAMADFGLNVATFVGPAIGDWRSLDLAAVEIEASINGARLMTGRGGELMGHPFNAVQWLCDELAARGRQIEAGEMVAVGSCFGLLQVTPGQTLVVDFDHRAQVSAQFE